jgi:hypothetical protein
MESSQIHQLLAISDNFGNIFQINKSLMSKTLIIGDQ